MPFFARYSNSLLLQELKRRSAVSDKPRVYAYNEYLPTYSSTSTVEVTLSNATLNFTPDPSSTYVYFYSCDVSGDTAAYNIIVRIKNTASTVINQFNWRPEAANDWNTFTGMSFETFGASPSAQSITFNLRVTNALLNASFRNIKILALKLTSADAFASNTNNFTSSSTTFLNSPDDRLTFTPATTGNYLIITSHEIASTTSTENAIATRLLINGSQVWNYNSTARLDDYLATTTIYYAAALSGTQNVQLSWASGRSGGFNVDSRRPALLALRLDEFGTTTRVRTDSIAKGTTSATYETANGTGSFATTDTLSYLVFGSAQRFSNSDSVSVGQGLSIDGKYYAESFTEEIALSTFGTEYMSPGVFTSFAVVTPGTNMFANIDIKAETTSANSQVDEIITAALVL